LTLIKDDEPDNRLLKSAQAACAEYLVTGSTKHFPKTFEAAMQKTRNGHTYCTPVKPSSS
jgi:hypothetical protein